MKFNINITEPNHQITNPVIIDSLERVIILQKPRFSDSMNFVRAIGTELSKNQAYVELACIVLLVKSISGMAVTIDSPEDVAFVIENLELAEDALPKILQSAADNFLDKEDRVRLIEMENLKKTYLHLH